jgi:hypothetical protein
MARPTADNTALLIGVITIVGGVATGLFSELRPLGQVFGVLTFAAWVLAIGLILWGRESSQLLTAIAFLLTAVLLVYAFVTGPRLSERTLLLTPAGVQVVDAACPDVARGSQVAGRVALSQLGEQFVHIECDRGEDVRIRSEDLQGVLPAP